MGAEGLAIERRGPTLLVTVDHGEENLFSVAMVRESSGSGRDASRRGGGAGGVEP